MVPGVRELDGQMPGWEKDFLCLLRYYILSIIAKKKLCVLLQLHRLPKLKPIKFLEKLL